MPSVTPRGGTPSFTPHRIDIVNGKKVRVPVSAIPNYFPAVVGREVFEQVASLTSKRTASTKGKGTLANILAGLAKCPHCGSTMTRIMKGGKKGGQPYLLCTRAKAGAGCTFRKVRLDQVTQAIVANVEWLVSQTPSPAEDLQGRWEQFSSNLDVLEDEIERIVQAIAQAGHSAALLDRLRETEAERDRVRAYLSEIERRIADTITNRITQTGEALVAVILGETIDIERANAMLRQLFERVIVHYPSGTLIFHWKHAPGHMTNITYAWPLEDAGYRGG